jgi:hypothetical protein
MGRGTGNLAGLAGVCNIAELAQRCLQTQSGETKVNSRHTVNPRKMAKLAPTESSIYTNNNKDNSELRI